MVGNSYTFFNDMPKLLADMLNHGGDDTYTVESIVRGGEKLTGHVSRGDVTLALTNKKYDIVFLQEQSTVSFYTNERIGSEAAFADLIAKVRQNGARPVVVGTWPRKEGDSFYSNNYSNFINPGNPKGMSAMLHTYYKNIALNNKADYLPVGTYWWILEERNPEIDLYAEDGSHPNAYGSYLFATLVYREITGILPDSTQALAWGLSQTFIDKVSALVEKKQATAGDSTTTRQESLPVQPTR